MVLPSTGAVFVSVANRDKRAIVFPAKRLVDLGFDLVATEGTADLLHRAGIEAEVVAKLSTGDRELLEMLETGRVGLVLNTPFGQGGRADGYEIRQAAVTHGVPCITTLAGILAAIQGIEALAEGTMTATSLQEYQRRVDELRAGSTT